MKNILIEMHVIYRGSKQIVIQLTIIHKLLVQVEMNWEMFQPKQHIINNASNYKILKTLIIMLALLTAMG